ncbi:MAG: hypothetical protein QXV85_10655 [Candidatus Bathyarchaeia archaeon]
MIEGDEEFEKLKKEVFDHAVMYDFTRLSDDRVSDYFDKLPFEILEMGFPYEVYELFILDFSDSDRYYYYADLNMLKKRLKVIYEDYIQKGRKIVMFKLAKNLIYVFAVLEKI